MNPRRSQTEKIDLLNLLRVKELTAVSGCQTSKIHDVTKATKPSFLEENSSFLPPIHSREMSTLSNGVGMLTTMNQSIGMDSTQLHSIEQTRFLKDSYRTSKRNSHMDPK